MLLVSVSVYTDASRYWQKLKERQNEERLSKSDYLYGYGIPDDMGVVHIRRVPTRLRATSVGPDPRIGRGRGFSAARNLWELREVIMNTRDIFGVWNKCTYQVAIYRRAWEIAVARGDYDKANVVRKKGREYEKNCGIFETWIWNSVQ